MKRQGMQKHVKAGQGGFTLIELLIVVAIIGILAAIAIPRYQDYLVKSRMSEVVLAASSCRTAVTEKFQTGTSGPGPGGWGCEVATGQGTQFVTTVGTDENGHVLVTASGDQADNIGANIDPVQVFLWPRASDGNALTNADIPGNPYSWGCGSDSADVRGFLPGTCSADASGAVSTTPSDYVSN